jgi:A/G-specific adenine glycosylase
LVRSLLTWFAQNARDLPWRRARAPYAIWVSEIMLQQTQVKTVLPYWERWMKALPDIAALAQAPVETLYKLWEGLGYYHRVRNMQAAARLIQTRHGGIFPAQFEQVLELPGIGRYTAGAICSIAFNQPQPVLDGNVIRVLTRLFGIEGDPREPQTNAQLWQLAAQLVERAHTLDQPKGRSRGRGRFGDFNGQAARACSALNQSLMELGATICTPRQPACEVCPLQKCCVACRERKVNELPALPRRIQATRRRFFAFVVSRRGRLLVRQRPDGVVNARLWEFPNTEVTLAEKNSKQAARAALGFAPAGLKPLGRLRHTITRYHIELDVFRAEIRNGAPIKPADSRWFTATQLTALAFASAHGKILRRFTGFAQPSAT